MNIHIIHDRPTPEQVREMMEAQGTFIKLAVDVRRRIIAGGGEMHADCEATLLEQGSSQDDIWGADWYPDENAVGFESFINIRPRQGNRSLYIQDPVLRAQVEEVVTDRLKP